MGILKKTLLICVVSLIGFNYLSAQTDEKPTNQSQIVHDEVFNDLSQFSDDLIGDTKDKSSGESNSEVQQEKLTKEQKKLIRKELKREDVKMTLKSMFPKRHSNVTSAAQPRADLLLVIITILIPPLGVALYENGITTNFWIDLLLTLLFYVPGLIFALIIILD